MIILVDKARNYLFTKSVLIQVKYRRSGGINGGVNLRLITPMRMSHRKITLIIRRCRGQPTSFIEVHI